LNGHLIDGTVMGEAWNGTAWLPDAAGCPERIERDPRRNLVPFSAACIAVDDASTASSASTLIEVFALARRRSRRGAPGTMT
jgi:hypothetical protein